jgi:hypothetical protein
MHTPSPQPDKESTTSAGEPSICPLCGCRPRRAPGLLCAECTFGPAVPPDPDCPLCQTRGRACDYHHSRGARPPLLAGLAQFAQAQADAGRHVTVNAEGRRHQRARLVKVEAR